MEYILHVEIHRLQSKQLLILSPLKFKSATESSFLPGQLFCFSLAALSLGGHILNATYKE